MMVLCIHSFFFYTHIYTRYFICTILIDLTWVLMSLFIHFIVLFSVLVTSSVWYSVSGTGHLQTCLFLVHLTNCTVSSASLGQTLSCNILLIGRFCPYTIFYNTLVLAIVAAYEFLDRASVATYEFLGISCQKTLVSLHSVSLCIDACMEHQHC